MKYPCVYITLDSHFTIIYILFQNLLYRGSVKVGINEAGVPVEGLEQCVVGLHPVYQLAPVLRGQGFQTIGVLPKIKLNSCCPVHQQVYQIIM